MSINEGASSVRTFDAGKNRDRLPPQREIRTTPSSMNHTKDSLDHDVDGEDSSFQGHTDKKQRRGNRQETIYIANYTNEDEGNSVVVKTTSKDWQKRRRIHSSLVKT